MIKMFIPTMFLMFLMFVFIFSFFPIFLMPIEEMSKSVFLSKNSLMLMFEESNNEEMLMFHDSFMFSWILGIGLMAFILLLSIYFSPEVSKMFKGNFMVEVVWVIFPSLVLLSIGSPSMELLYSEEESEEVNPLVFKSTGLQWFWVYETPSTEGEVEAYMQKEGSEDFISFLSADGELELPSLSPLINMITSEDVIHSWTIVSEMIKMDAISGRINSIYFSLSSLENSKYFGQCSELCGINHSFMPISIKTF